MSSSIFEPNARLAISTISFKPRSFLKKSEQLILPACLATKVHCLSPALDATLIEFRLLPRI